MAGRGGFGKYETQSRSRTSSFSRHGGGTASGCNSGATSPVSGITSERVAAQLGVTTASSVSTPRGAGRPRTTRYLSNAEYFSESGGAGSGGSELNERRNFRSYDEYSQGSAASHDECYDAVHPSAGTENFIYPSRTLEGSSGPRLHRSSSGDRCEVDRQMVTGSAGCDSPPPHPPISANRIEAELGTTPIRRRSEKSPGMFHNRKGSS